MVGSDLTRAIYDYQFEENFAAVVDGAKFPTKQGVQVGFVLLCSVCSIINGRARPGYNRRRLDMNKKFVVAMWPHLVKGCAAEVDTCHGSPMEMYCRVLHRIALGPVTPAANKKIGELAPAFGEGNLGDWFDYLYKAAAKGAKTTALQDGALRWVTKQVGAEIAALAD
jgi:hypothetical protein